MVEERLIPVFLSREIRSPLNMPSVALSSSFYRFTLFYAVAVFLESHAKQFIFFIDSFKRQEVAYCRIY